MADNKSAFIKRVISALVAGFGLLGVYLYFGRIGLECTCLAMACLGLYEYANMAFGRLGLKRDFSFTFFLLGALTVATMASHHEHSQEIFSVGAAIAIVVLLWSARHRVDNETMLRTIGAIGFGWIYCLMLPYYSILIAGLNDGSKWFLFLLLVVFAGDTFAYFFGRFLGGKLFGAKKMYPEVSPNKTWEGALGGIVGSVTAGLIHLNFAFAQSPPIHLTVLFCTACGVAAQSGDLLMSLVKRVAHVKDSGHIMPGHGGVLDRLDGIYIACPLVYGFALYVTAV